MSSVIYLSGLPKAGKSTLLHRLQSTLGGTCVEEFSNNNPPAFLKEYANPQSQIKATEWALEHHAFKNVEVEKLTGTVFVDRTGIDPLLYLLATHGTIPAEIWQRFHQTSWVPGLHIFLTARPGVLKERYEKRGGIWNEIRQELITNLHTIVCTHAEKTNAPLIDTSDMSPEEVEEKALQIIATNTPTLFP